MRSSKTLITVTLPASMHLIQLILFGEQFIFVK